MNVKAIIDEVELKSNIANRAWNALELAKRTHGRKPDLEKTISQNASASFEYARDVLKGPFPEGENAISHDGELAVWYAMGILKQPWPEAEPAILAHKQFATEYFEFLQQVDAGYYMQACIKHGIDPHHYLPEE